MNPLVLFLPTFRASTTAYLAGLVVLAILDYARLTYLGDVLPWWLTMLAILFFVFSLHANRRRHAGEGVGLAVLPVFIALIGKGIGSLVGIFGSAYTSMMAFAEANGIDTSDQQVLAETMNDPQFQQAWQASLEADDGAGAMAMFSNTAMPSFIGFWIVIALFAIWFAQMKRVGGSLQDTETAAPAPMQVVEPANDPVGEETPSDEAQNSETPNSETPNSETSADNTGSDEEPKKD